MTTVTAEAMMQLKNGIQVVFHTGEIPKNSPIYTVLKEFDGVIEGVVLRLSDLSDGHHIEVTTKKGQLKLMIPDHLESVEEVQEYINQQVEKANSQ